MLDGMMKKLHHSQFMKKVKETFPELRMEINKQYGLIHLEVSVFTRFVQGLIDSGGKDTLVKALQIANYFILYGNGKVVNALTVSFLEHLNFKNGKVPRQWAWECMTPALKDQYNGINKYFDELFRK
jgi:hypothetical protein